MKNFLLLILLSISYNFYCQEVPPPPPPPPSKTTNNSIEEVYENVEQINEVEGTYSNNDKVCNIEVFKIDNTSFTDKKSKFYHEKIKNKLNELNLDISDEEIISYTKYRNNLDFDPFKIDSIASAIYKLNENSEFNKAIELCNQLKSISPNNITLHKELSFAYKKIGKAELSEKHFEMMKKIINAVEKYSDGCRINPYILNNYFEEVSFYEAIFECFPKKTRFILTKDKKIIFGCDCYHIMRFSDLNHYKKYLNEGDYKVE